MYWLKSLSFELKSFAFYVVIHLISFFSDIVMSYAHERSENLAKIAWFSVQKNFETSFKRVDKHVQRVKEKTQVTSVSEKFLKNDQAVLVRELKRLKIVKQITFEMNSEKENVALSCSNISFSKNSYFFDRQTELNLIRETLNHNAEIFKFEFLVLCDMSEIEKTQIALTYVHERVSKDILVVFWVNSEIVINMTQSFTQIATSLNFKDAAAEDDHELNCYLIMKWLQKTRERILLDLFT